MGILEEEAKKNKIGIFNDSKFICPKCLSYFGERDIPEAMRKGKFFTIGKAITWSLGLSIFGAIFLMIKWIGAVEWNAGLAAWMGGASNYSSYLNRSFSGGNVISAFFSAYFISFIVLVIVLGFISILIPEPEQRCPSCKRIGKFVTSNSKEGMLYVNKKMITELSSKEKDNTNDKQDASPIKQQTNDKIKDLYASWRQNKK